MRINGRFTVNEAGAGRVLTLKQPVGPCVFITPWNFPLAMGTRKIGAGHRGRLHDGRQAAPSRRRSRCSCWPRSSSEVGPARPAC